MSKYESIKKWAVDDMPREKLIKHGKQVLSDAELIGILISTGAKEKSAIDLSREVLKLADGSLNTLARLNVKELCKINGIGPAKAISIIAALELGARRERFTGDDKLIVDGSKKVFQMLKADLQDLQYEQFWVVTLSRRNEYINKYKISEGGISGTVADPKRIFKTALDDHASGIILLHNHPSGSLKPSEADKQITSKLIEAGKALDISVLDHLIIANTGYFSFADEGILTSHLN